MCGPRDPVDNARAKARVARVVTRAWASLSLTARENQSLEVEETTTLCDFLDTPAIHSDRGARVVTRVTRATRVSTPSITPTHPRQGAHR